MSTSCKGGIDAVERTVGEIALGVCVLFHFHPTSSTTDKKTRHSVTYTTVPLRSIFLLLTHAGALSQNVSTLNANTALHIIEVCEER